MSSAISLSKVMSAIPSKAGHRRDWIIRAAMVWRSPPRARSLGLAQVAMLIAATVGLATVDANATPSARQPSHDDDAIRWMSGEELSATFSGVTIQGHYAGDARGFTETYRADGGIAYEERDRAQVGTWSVVSGTFCTIYSPEPTGGCYRVRQLSGNCYEFYFVARTLAQAERLRFSVPSLTARAAVANRPSTCDERPSV